MKRDDKEKDRIRITISTSKELLKLIDEDEKCREIYLGARSPFINQIIKKHFGLRNIFGLDLAFKDVTCPYCRNDFGVTIGYDLHKKKDKIKLKKWGEKNENKNI